MMIPTYDNRTLYIAAAHSRACEIKGAACLVRDVYQYRVLARPERNGFRSIVWDMDAPSARDRRIVFKSITLWNSLAEAVWYGTAVVCQHVEYDATSEMLELP